VKWKNCEKKSSEEKYLPMTEEDFRPQRNVKEKS